MQNLVTLGLPIYYAGEVNLSADSLIHLYSRRLGGQQFDFYRFKPETGILKETFFALTEGNSRYTFGMWHPPLYIYLGALFLRLKPLTPETSFLLRYFNLIFSIGIFAGMVALSRELYRDRHRAVVSLALLLYVLNSLAVRGTILVDYNATLAPCLTIWFVVAYLRSERRRRFHLGLALLTSLAFLTGLGVGITLLIGIAVYTLIVGCRRSSWPALASIGGGVLAFFPLFALFSRLLGLPFSQPFLHNFQRTGAQPDAAWVLSLLKAAAEFSVFYSRELGICAVLVGAGLAVRLLLIRHAPLAPQRALAPILVAVGFLLQGSLRAEAYGFPKYILFLLPLFFVFLAGETLDLLQATTTPRAAKLVIGIAVIALLLTQAWTSLAAHQRPGSALYFRGQTGIEAISRQVSAHTAPDETILSPKDVAFFAGRRFVQWYGKPLSNVDYLRRWVSEEHITTLATDTASLNAASPAVAEYLRNNFALQGQEGDFRLLRANATP
jgi:MFS family permease